jgi:signal transduction histidine kinase
MGPRLRPAGPTAHPPVVRVRTLTCDGFSVPAAGPKVVRDMRIRLAAPRGALRRPSVQDAGLAALLLLGTWAVTDAGREPARWVPIGVCVGAVAVRRRWPVPALVAAALATRALLATAAGPAPADLAVPIVVYTLAAHRRRRVSLAALGTVLVVATGWSVYVALRTDGSLYQGPFGGGRQDTPPAGPGDRGGIVVLGCLLILAWAIGWGLRSRRAYLGELRARAQDLEHERDRQAALAVAAERARITRELHDVVAHGLAVIVMQAQGGAAAFAKRPTDTLAALDTIVATGRASLADMRHVLSASGPIEDPARPVPGLAQLPRLVERVRQAGTPVALRVDGTPPALPTGVDVSSYRIVQEALTNTMKHAGPGARARVTVSYARHELRLDVSDDGTGGSSPGGTGNGLRGMRERAALLGGEVTAGPGPDGGYAVRARLPLDPGGTG